MKTNLKWFDVRVTKMIQAWPASVRPVMVAASVVGLPVLTLGLGGLILLIGIIQHRHDLLVGSGIAVSVILIGDVMKLTIRRPRPPTDPGRHRRYRTYSFPSGHALGAMVVFGMLALLSATSGNGGNLWVWLTDAGIVFLVGASRVYLGAHYPSDVLAGWLIGALGLVAIILASGASGF